MRLQANNRRAESPASPVIFDAHGRPAARYSTGLVYDAARNNRERTLYPGGQWTRPRPESEMLPMGDRLAIIAYLRQSIRNNPVMAALAYRKALAIGSPTVRSMTADGGINDAKERILEKRLARIMWGTGWSWHRLHKLITVEELIAGEVFAVEVEDKVQLIPSELCGSPAVPPDNEFDGIGYDADGTPLYYRFGKRIPTAKGSRFTRVTFEQKEGAQIVDAEFVHHLGTPSRIEERRFSPKLAPVIGLVQSLDDIIKAKVTTVKNQAAMSMFFTKNFDPAMFGESMGAALEQHADVTSEILAQATARSDYTEIRNGTVIYGEVGEDLKLIEPNLNAQDFSQFVLSLMDQICAPVGMFPEEVLIGYRNSNYSSARADRNRLKDVLIDERAERTAFCDAIVSRQLGIAVDSGDFEGYSNAAQVPADGTADVFYAWPIVREIDETKHILAQVAAKDSQIKSDDQLNAENGTYGDQTATAIVANAARLARLVKAQVRRITARSEIEEIEVTEQEVLAMMPRGDRASEAIKAISAANAAEENAAANTTRANATAPNQPAA